MDSLALIRTRGYYISWSPSSERTTRRKPMPQPDLPERRPHTRAVRGWGCDVSDLRRRAEERKTQ